MPKFMEFYPLHQYDIYIQKEHDLNTKPMKGFTPQKMLKFLFSGWVLFEQKLVHFLFILTEVFDNLKTE